MTDLKPKRRSSTLLTVQSEEGNSIVLVTPDLSGVHVEVNSTDVHNQIIHTRYKNKSLTAEFVVLLHAIQDHIRAIVDIIRDVLREDTTRDESLDETDEGS